MKRGCRLFRRFAKETPCRHLKTSRPRSTSCCSTEWKNLYLPVLDILKPKLRKGSVVVADNIRHPFIVRKTMARYVACMHDPANGFRSTTLPIGSGIEYSVFEG